MHADKCDLTEEQWPDILLHVEANWVRFHIGDFDDLERLLFVAREAIFVNHYGSPQQRALDHMSLIETSDAEYDDFVIIVTLDVSGGLQIASRRIDLKKFIELKGEGASVAHRALTMLFAHRNETIEKLEAFIGRLPSPGGNA